MLSYKKKSFDVLKISQNIFFEPFSHLLHFFLCQILAQFQSMNDMISLQILQSQSSVYLNDVIQSHIFGALKGWFLLLRIGQGQFSFLSKIFFILFRRFLNFLDLRQTLQVRFSLFDLTPKCRIYFHLALYKTIFYSLCTSNQIATLFFGTILGEYNSIEPRLIM